MTSNEFNELEEKLEGWERDAMRYRWLRDRHPADEGLWVAMGRPHTPAGISCWREESLDAAIDAAMRAERADGDA